LGLSARSVGTFVADLVLDCELPVVGVTSTFVADPLLGGELAVVAVTRTFVADPLLGGELFRSLGRSTRSVGTVVGDSVLGCELAVGVVFAAVPDLAIVAATGVISTGNATRPFRSLTVMGSTGRKNGVEPNMELIRMSSRN
jgi:hypothetical protein